MKVYLDDRRKTPEGWISARWPEDVIRHLQTGMVTHLDLDYYLSESGKESRTGYDVLIWIFRAVKNSDFKPPVMKPHTSSPDAMNLMNAAIVAIHWNYSMNHPEI